MRTIDDVHANPDVTRLLQAAREGGVVRLLLKDGEEFVLSRVIRSALDVPPVRPMKPISRDEIVAMVREGREREPQWMRDSFARHAAAHDAEGREGKDETLDHQKAVTGVPGQRSLLDPEA